MSESSREWIGVSDLMAGLMMVFLFIAVLFMVKIEREKRAIEEIAVTYDEYKQTLNDALHDEFDRDLKKWNAEIRDDNIIRFKGPDVLFEGGKSKITMPFKDILNDFFPRYIGLLTRDKFMDNIDEVRIEGHTSSEWEGAMTLEKRYLPNAKLSQERSLAVLTHCFELVSIQDDQKWLTKVLRANGMAFAKLIVVDGVENRTRSRRVEFRVKTKAEERIEKIIRAIQSEGT